jgi:fructose-1,6-bisphosphatase I
MRRYVDWLKEEDEPTGRPYSARYIGSLVADFHRNLMYGGLYLYPGDVKSPSGKLRLLYEAAPLAFIAEQAGGAATDGKKRIMDIAPERLHQRTPLVIGSRRDVEECMQFMGDKHPGTKRDRRVRSEVRA